MAAAGRGRRGRAASTPRSDARHARIEEQLRILLPGGQRLVIVSNRGPITFRRRGEAWTTARGSGGLVTALAELGRHAPVTWVSAAMGRDDREAAHALAGGHRERTRVEAAIAEQLPGQDLRLMLAEVPERAWQAHYARIANPFLWFLQHQIYRLAYEPVVDAALLAAWRDGYRVVNEALGRAALRAAGRGRPVILLQDYHLYLCAEAIRRERSDALLLHFTHIPWPSDSTWQLLPQRMRRAICEGLLANDVVGLQTDRYAENFLGTVASFVRDAQIDPDGRNVRWRGRTVYVRAYPISVDTDALARFAEGDRVRARMAAFRDRLERAGRPRLIVRVDRLEPSKNVLRGFLAFEALLERRPELRREVRFLAVASTTREALPEYTAYAAAVREIVARVNRMEDPDRAPIWLVDGSEYELAIAAMRLADVMLVNPVVDGMNLVAKEAVIVGDPVLVLSETAGAAEQLAADALMVTAADVAGTAEMLEAALAMSPEERRRRARRLRASVRSEDLAWWLGRQLRDLAAVSAGTRPPSRQLRDTIRRVEDAGF